VLAAALFLSISFVHGIWAPVAAQPETLSVRLNGSFELDFLPRLPDSVDSFFQGNARIIWTWGGPGRVQAELDTCRLWNWRGSWMNEDPLMPSHGLVSLPGDNPWIESFFDVYLEIHVPQFPGESLRPMIRIHIGGMANAWPPYFEDFSMPEGMPPIPLFSDGIESGHILSFNLEMVPYYKPSVEISIPTAYGSEVAELNEAGLVTVHAALTGDREAIEAVFGYRLYGDPGPFTVFDVDVDGGAPHLPTVDPSDIGNGWEGHFDPGSDPFEGGQVVEVEAALFVPGLGILADTAQVWVEETPPIPSFFDISQDSIANFDIDSFFDVTFKLDDELPMPGTSQLLLFPLEPRCERVLPRIDIHDLGTPLDDVSCAPATAASIMKYFAMNGYPGLDHPEGDETRPEESVEDMAKEFQGIVGTDPFGTDEYVMPVGVSRYGGRHGRWVWMYNFKEVYCAYNLAEMYREFESDTEEVGLCISDTTASGDYCGISVSLETVDTSTDPMTIGFVDPEDGEYKEFPLDFSHAGAPTIVGYNVPGCSGGNAQLAGYMKFSPTWVPDDGARTLHGPRQAPLRAPWILLDTGMARGNGLVDTLHFDTTPFPPGWYLLEVVTVDNMGFQCRDIRLARIGAATGVDDPRGPGMKTMLRGSYPNPFNPTTTIEYSLERDAKVTLAIYDVTGQKVRTLISGAGTEAGIHTVSWDGTNDAGTRLASGVYFASLAAEGRVSSRKLVLLR